MNGSKPNRNRHHIVAKPQYHHNSQLTGDLDAKKAADSFFKICGLFIQRGALSA